MNDNTIIRIKVPTHLYESVKAKLMIKEDEYTAGSFFGKKEEPKEENPNATGVAKPAKDQRFEEEEKTVTVSLNEYTGDPAMYDLGSWVADSFPSVAKWFGDLSTTDDPGQKLVDLGTAVFSLATVGTIALSVTLAVVKDDIKAAAKKLISAVKGGVKEGDADAELADVISKLPKDGLAKIAKQNVKETEANENLNEAKKVDPKKAAEAKKKEDEKKKKEADAKKKAAEKKK